MERGDASSPFRGGENALARASSIPASSSSASLTAMAVPPLARTASRIRKSPSGLGTRNPAATGWKVSAASPNELIQGLENLLACAVGAELPCNYRCPAAVTAHADLGLIELLLMHLALAANEPAYPGAFAIATSTVSSKQAGDSYAVIA